MLASGRSPSKKIIPQSQKDFPRWVPVVVRGRVRRQFARADVGPKIPNRHVANYLQN